jgi:hypothetical protein
MNKKQKILIDKHKLLNDFLNKHKNLPSQGTQEWLDGRTYRIGGSEIATILGKNKYQTKKDLVKSHVGLKPFLSFYMVHWGSLLEDALRDHINKIYKCDIIETGSIPHKEHNTIAYSPDGIAVVDTKHVAHLLDDTVVLHEHSIILFEFKCPYSRVPTGDVPEHYIDQPRLGMEVIDICDSAIFIEAVYKLASYDNLIYNNIYNMGYHKDKELLTNNPINYGVLVLYYDTIHNKDENKEITLEDLIGNDLDENNLIEEIENEICKLKYDIEIKINDKKIYDLSKIKNGYIINKILAGCACKERKCFKIDYELQYTYNEKNFNITNKYVNKFNNKSLLGNLTNNLDKKLNELNNDNKKVFGILPYKLFNLFINPVKKEKILTNEVINEIDNIVNVIKLCKDKDLHEKGKVINENFNKKK